MTVPYLTGERVADGEEDPEGSGGPVGAVGPELMGASRHTDVV